MSMSATISVLPTSVVQQEPSLASVVISNSGGSPVSVLSCLLNAIFTGDSFPKDTPPAAFAAAPLNGNFPFTVPAGGSITLNLPVILFLPSARVPPAPTTYSTYDISAVIYTSDGSTFSPSAAQLTVTAIPITDAT